MIYEMKSGVLRAAFRRTFICIVPNTLSLTNYNTCLAIALLLNSNYDAIYINVKKKNSRQYSYLYGWYC